MEVSGQLHALAPGIDWIAEPNYPGRDFVAL